MIKYERLVQFSVNNNQNYKVLDANCKYLYAGEEFLLKRSPGYPSNFPVKQTVNDVN